MGVNSLKRESRDNVSAVWYEHKNINADGRATQGKHLKVRIEERVGKTISQPIKNLITDEHATLVSTLFNYDYGKYDELYFLGKRWQVLDRQVEVEKDSTNALSNPMLNTRTYIAIMELGGKKLWTIN